MAAVSVAGFVVCFVLGAAFYGNGAGNSALDITAYYARESERLRQIADFAVALAALLCFLVFVAALRRALPSGVAADTVLAAGTSVPILLGAAMLSGPRARSPSLEPSYHIDPRTLLLVEDAGFVLFVSAGAVGITFVGAALLPRRFRRWFVWVSISVLGALAAAYWYIPFSAFLAWVLVAGLLL